MTHPLDRLVLVLYFVALLAIGWKQRNRSHSEREMLVGDGRIPWWAVLLSVLGTEISALTFVGVPALAYSGNWTYLQVTLGAIGGRFLVGRYFVPAFFRHQVVSIYEFLHTRYGPWTRNMAVAIFLTTRVLMSGVRLYAGSLVLQIALGISVFQAVPVLAVLGLIFSALGGVRSVVWTEVLQVFVMFAGALCACGVLFFSLPEGAWSQLPQGSTQIWDFRLQPELEFTFWAALLGTTLTNTAIFGTDYDMVQRMLTAKDSGQSRKAVIGSGLAEVPIALLFLTIGSLLRLYYQAHPDPHLPSEAKHVFGYFIVTQMPPVLCGLLVAAVISVVLSTYESALTALAGSFVIDFYKPLAGDRASHPHLLTVTRGATGLFAGLLCLVAFQSRNIGEILKFGLEVGTYTYGALLAAFGVALIRPEQGKAGSDRWTALVAMPASVLLVVWIKSHTALAFPWFVGLGASLTALLVWPTYRRAEACEPPDDPR